MDDRFFDLQERQIEIMKIIAESLNRPIEIHVPEVSQVLSQAGTFSAVPAEEVLGQVGTKPEVEVIIDEKEIVVKDVQEVARKWYLEDKSRLKLSLREAADLSGISKSTLGRVKQELSKNNKRKV